MRDEVNINYNMVKYMSEFSVGVQLLPNVTYKSLFSFFDFTCFTLQFLNKYI